MAKKQEPSTNGESKLYGTFEQSVKDRQFLKEMVLKREPLIQMAYRKARNLPVDDDLHIDNRQYQIGDSPWLSLAKNAAIIAGLLGAGLIGASLNAPQKPTEQVRPTTDADTRYELRMID